MQNRINEIVSKYVKAADKSAQLSEELFELFLSVKCSSKARKYEDKVIDGKVFKYCTMAKAYFEESEFVKGKKYTKCAYRLWDKLYRTANSMRSEAGKALRAKTISLDEYELKYDEADKLDQSRHLAETYAHLGGLQPDEI